MPVAAFLKVARARHSGVAHAPERERHPRQPCCQHSIHLMCGDARKRNFGRGGIKVSRVVPGQQREQMARRGFDDARR